MDIRNESYSSPFDNLSTQAPGGRKESIIEKKGILLTSKTPISENKKKSIIRSIVENTKLGRVLLKKTMRTLVSGEEVSQAAREKSVQKFKDEGLGKDRGVQRLTVTTSEGVSLDAMVIHPKGGVQETGKASLILHGLGERYECNDLDQAAKFADDTGQAVYVFNYRGTGDSRGTEALSLNDYVDDAQSMMAAISEDTKVDQANISLYGHSFGGAIASKAAASHKDAAKIKLVADRSMNSVSQAATSVVQNLASSKVGKVAMYIPAKVAGVLVKATGAEMHVGRHLSKLNGDNVLILSHPEDKMIVKKASLSNSVKRFTKLSKKPPKAIDITDDIHGKKNEIDKKIDSSIKEFEKLEQEKEKILDEIKDVDENIGLFISRYEDETRSIKIKYKGVKTTSAYSNIASSLSIAFDNLLNDVDNLIEKMKKKVEEEETIELLMNLRGGISENKSDLNDLNSEKSDVEKEINTRLEELSKLKILRTQKNAHGRSLWLHEAEHTAAVELFKGEASSSLPPDESLPGQVMEYA